MYPILIQLGTFELRTYGIIVALSFFLGLWLSAKEAKRKGLDPNLIQDFAFYALVGGIIGARIYFVVFSNPSYFLQNPWEILAFWHGGIGIIGALIGGLATALWYCRKYKLSFWNFADTLAPGVILAQAAGVFACLLNGDSYGKAADLAWAITYTDPRSMAPLNIARHPVEIYEMAAYLLVFLLVWQTRKKYRTAGFVFLTYLAGYGAARFAVEFFRGNPALFAWGIPAAQVFGVALLLLAAAGFYLRGAANEIDVQSEGKRARAGGQRRK
ncbi:MAG: prolipoprotein diacylglyceryl transferase [Burkholderiales bacterium]|nr:prolipoprotein diacylglyceryl transferase [Burkholderiales bacterium]